MVAPASLFFVRALSGPLSVSTLTTLLPWTPFIQSPKTLFFAVINLDPVNPVTVVVDTTELPEFADDDKATTLTIGPLRQGSTEIGPSAVRNYFRLSAQTESPTFPTVLVRWCCRAYWTSGL